MDVVLNLCDEYVLDRVWAKLVPLSAFVSSPDVANSFNLTSTGLPLPASSSKWTQFVLSLPRPRLTTGDIASLSAQSFTSQTIPQVSAWPRDYIPRQLASLIVITLLGIHILYFLFASLSYAFIFNHDMMRHPRFLKNQVKLEIQTSVKAFPMMLLLTLPWFQAEVMGYSRLYDEVDTYGWAYLVLSVPL
jgi:lathosterol oxidase